MDSATAAVMVLLSCSPGAASICKPVDTTSPMFASMEQCRTSLADRLAYGPNGKLIGRCRPIDPTVTGSLPAGFATVVVTRGIGRSVGYIVPHKD